MFYKHFESKEIFLAELVEVIGSSLRRHQRLNEFPTNNRIRKELHGWAVFLAYFEDRKHYYEILREAEFVLPESARNYYNRLETGYLKNLNGLRIEDSHLATNYLLGLGHYLGVEYFFSDMVLDSEALLIELGRMLYRGVNISRSGR